MMIFNTLKTIAAATGSKENKEKVDLLSALASLVKRYPNGVDGLLENFKQEGLGDLLKSWTNVDTAQPPSEAQLKLGLTPSVLHELTNDAGLSESKVLQYLSTMLPVLVRKWSEGTDRKFDLSLLGELMK